MDGGDPSRLLLLDLGSRFANEHVVNYFRGYIKVERDDAARHFLGDDHLSRAELDGVIATHPYAVAMYDAAKCYQVAGRWGDRGPLFKLTAKDDAFRMEYFGRIGMPDDAWFVCLHAREGGYSPADEAVHKFRSVSIESYETAVQLITDAGGWVFRMGDASMRSTEPRPRVIDYALSADKSARMDIALCGACRFFLGSSSGPTVIASIFGRPAVIAHMAPMGASLGYMPMDLSIAQIMRDNTGRKLNIREQMQGRCSSFRLAEEFASAGLTLEPNSKEAIAAVTQEMLDVLSGRAIYSTDDSCRQSVFRSLFNNKHYCYGAPSTLGREYLKEHLP